jgi:excisionase family DNA binding protein
MNDSPGQALATVAQAAAYLNVCKTTIYDLTDAGDLPFLRIKSVRRIRWSDLRRLAGEEPQAGGTSDE